MNSHTDIPALCYTMLRDVNESRAAATARRLGKEAIVPRLTNAQIFLLMPDHKRIDWTQSAQPALIEATLAAMLGQTEYVEFEETVQ